MALATPLAVANHCVERARVSLLFALDVSRSMMDPVAGTTKLDLARRFAIDVVSGINATGQLGEASVFTFCIGVVDDIDWGDAAATNADLAGTIRYCTGGGTAVHANIVEGVARLNARSNPNKFLVVLTDGADTTGTPTAIASAALSDSSTRSRLVAIGGGFAELSRVAAAAGPNHAAIPTTPEGLAGLVSDVVNATCGNHGPHAQIALSDSDLQLGVEGFQITFDGSRSNDAETTASALGYAWTLTPTAGRTPITAIAMSFTHTFGEAPSGGEWWSVALDVTDARGAHGNASLPFLVRGSAPVIRFFGGGTIDALQPLQVGTSQETDIDGGGRYLFNWRVNRGPGGGSLSVGSSWAGTARAPLTPHSTTENDITLLSDSRRHRDPWVFHLRVEDNEHEVAEGDVAIEVRNLPPVLRLAPSPDQTRVGQTVELSNSESRDPDGGDLTHEWRIVQKPDRSPRPLGIVSTSSAFRFDAGASDAGTWIFRVVATDNETESTEPQTRSVLVDAPPVAVISGGDMSSLTRVGSITGILRLSARDSFDPDNPCPDNPPNFCHANADGPVMLRSTERLRYEWSVVDVPRDHRADFSPGGIDELFGVAQGRVDLELPPRRLRPGTWTFQLQVTDGEGNDAYATHTVEVFEQNGYPIAVLQPLSRYDVIPGGQLIESAIFDGSLSFDIDEVLRTGTYFPGIGISRFDWLHFYSPPGCPSATFASAPTALLHAGGVVVPRPCYGLHMLQLTVTDHDAAPKTGIAVGGVILGSCPTAICIDAPTTDAPYHVQYTKNTDVLIYYHVDDSLYEDYFFSTGLYVRLEIFHESDPTTPIYVAADVNVLRQNQRDLVFHWDGRNTVGAYPAQGRYDVRLTLHNGSAASYSVRAEAPASIYIETAQISIEPDSDRWAFIDQLSDPARSEPIGIRYTIVGLGRPDEVLFHVYDASGVAVHTGSVTSPGTSGAIAWDGRLTGATVIGTGVYGVELEARRGAETMGRSARSPLRVMRLDIDVDTDRNGTIDDVADESNEDQWMATSGAVFTANNDRDGALSSGAYPTPDTIDIDDAGNPRSENEVINGIDDMADITPVVIRGLGINAPTGLRFFLRVPSVEDAQSIHIFKKIEDGQRKILGALGDRVAGHTPADTEVEITDYLNAANPAHVGMPGDPRSPMSFGLEGLLLRNEGLKNRFDGDVEIVFEARETIGSSARAVYSDTVKLRVAPWLMLPNTRPSTQLRAADWGRFNDDFLHAPFDATTGHTGLNHAGSQLRELASISSQYIGTQWLQDHVETGYTQRPGGPVMLSTFRHPYQYGTLGQPTWPLLELLRTNSALFQLGQNIGADAGMVSHHSGSYGGNLELLPPTMLNPQGRIVVGDTRSDELWNFLNSQQFQPPFEIPLRWLSVGHVDEAVGFNDRGTETVLADTQLAYRLLEAIPPAERGRTVLFNKSGGTQEGVVSADSLPDRLETAVDLTGTAWRYVRVFSGTAAGQVARVTPRNGYLEVHEVWDTTSRVIDAIGDSGSLYDQTSTVGGADILDSAGRAHHSTTWLHDPRAGDRYVLVVDTQFWQNLEGSTTAGAVTTITSPAVEIPALITVDEILRDSNLRRLNATLIHAKLEAIRRTIEAAAAEPIMIHRVPVLYFGTLADFDEGRHAHALTPNLANFQVIDGNLYFPRQFGVKNSAGRDIFEEHVRSIFPGALFVDDWDLYHSNMGEVHCGTTRVNSPPAGSRDWWRP